MGRFEELIQKWNLVPREKALREASREAVSLVPDLSITKLNRGASKLGGNPDVPSGFSWPAFKDNPLSFVCQINLADVKTLMPADVTLPDRGILSFFYSPLVAGYDPGDRDGFRVCYFDCEPGELVSQTPPSVPPQKKLFGLISLKRSVQVYRECAITYEKLITLPDDPERFELSEDLCESYFELLEELGGHHRLLGFAEPIQGSMELECEMVTHGIYCGDARGYESPGRKELEKTAGQWKLLLQIDSDTENSDMMWGDAGRLYYWIKDADLRERRFEKCWFIFQCY